MAKAILKPHIADILKTKYGAMGDIPDIAFQDPGDGIIKEALGKYKRDTNDIEDMKSDIRKRLIQPMCLVAMEKQGVNYHIMSLTDKEGICLPLPFLCKSNYSEHEADTQQLRGFTTSLKRKSVRRYWHTLDLWSRSLCYTTGFTAKSIGIVFSDL